MKRMMPTLAVLLLGGAACTTIAPTMSDPTTAPPTGEPPGSAAFTLSSPDMQDGGRMPVQFTCDGANSSPPLAFSGAPAGTIEFLLVVTDRDVAGQTQWIVANIPVKVTSFNEGALPPSAVELTNSSGGARWWGPCPTSGQNTYQFSLYALDKPSTLSKASDRAAVDTVMRRATAVATFDGTYKRG